MVPPGCKAPFGVHKDGLLDPMGQPFIDEAIVARAKQTLRDQGLELVEHDTVLATKQEARAALKKMKDDDRVCGVVLFSATWVWAAHLVAAVRGDYPEMDVVTVVHVATNYTSAGIDHYVEGGNLSADYARGQDIVRTLWESNDACSFLCNVSHGGPASDFALTRGGTGFPSGVSPAVILSMSCSSYLLGQAALTSGVAAAYLGSTAVVTPDVLTIFAGHDMVSAVVQQSASLNIFCRGETLGRAFGEEFDYYTRHIVLEGCNAYINDRAGMLRNVVGFQLIGDPTLRHAHPDHDGDGVPNDDELLAGTDPMSRLDYPRLGGRAGRLECASHTGRTYGIEVSTSMLTPEWSAVGDSAPGTGSNLSFEVPLLEEPAACYRLRIAKP